MRGFFYAIFIFMKNRNETCRIKRGYNQAWLKARLVFLKENPLCVYCLKQGKHTPATVVDHIIPHKDNPDLFWDESNWQSLCHKCHASIKQREEHGKDVRPVGLDGWRVG